jgi:hypothetical protein
LPPESRQFPPRPYAVEHQRYPLIATPFVRSRFSAWRGAATSLTARSHRRVRLTGDRVGLYSDSQVTEKVVARVAGCETATSWGRAPVA